MDPASGSFDLQPCFKKGRERLATTSLVLCVLASLGILMGGCVILIRKADVKEIQTRHPPTQVISPIKAHLYDGSVVVFAEGGEFRADTLFGVGRHYGLTLKEIGRMDRLSLDSVAALETFKSGVNASASTALSALATGVGVFGGALLYKALFGSCPTIYSESNEGALLEGEMFTNSIAPLLEMRDVSRLHARADASDVLKLEVRNEALETHYINHLELLEVLHEPDEFAVPGERGRAMLVSDIRVPDSMVDRAGNDVRPVLRSADDRAFRTDERVLGGVTPDDLLDHIDVVLSKPASDSVAVLFRLKNSLLNTVLFYDYMLSAQGPAALDWIGRELESIGTVATLGEFFSRRMGLRVHVRDESGFREVGRVREVGPIAWKDVAIAVPVPEGDSLRIRLSFVADGWRIDRVAVAARFRTSPVRAISVHRVVGADGAHDEQTRERLLAADEQYHVTGPGDRFSVRFAVGESSEGNDRTFFLAAQGYYIEWVRGDWVREAKSRTKFVASDETLYAAIMHWKVLKASFEQRFDESRIPVR